MRLRRITLQKKSLSRTHVNVGSISGGFPSQGVAVYGASKSFLDSFTTALHRELGGSGVKVSILRAGPVQTEFCRTAASLPGGFHLPTEHIGISAQAVALAVLRLIKKPRRVLYVPSWLAITPWIEACFGRLIDQLGPLMLKRYNASINSKNY